MNGSFDTVWVIGLGAVGARWATLLAGKGRRVIGLEPDGAALDQARDRVKRLTGRTLDELGIVAGTIDRLDLAPSQADLVIEAVPERMELKAEVLRRAHAGCAPDAVFATTTIGLPVTEIAALGGRMTRTVGLQLCDWAGAGAGGVVEITRTPVTDEGVLNAVRALVGDLGAAATTGHDHPASAGSALLLRYLNRAAAMYERGYASRDDIDTAMTLGCGLPVGPLALLDRIGIDTAHDSLDALARRTGDRSWAPARILTLMREAGLRGRESGQGFYDHRTPAAARPPAAPRPGTGREIHRVGVMGTGTMAVGIAEVFAGAGYTTALVARSDVRAKQARDVIGGSLERRVRKGRLAADAMAAAMDRLACGSDLDALAGCDLVVEAVTEELAVKRDVFGRLDRLVRPGAILATTTSSLPVIQCATATTRPQDVIGLHFFNPAPVMRLVEVVHTFLTAGEVVDTATGLVTALGKHPVRCGDQRGFIVNALLLPYLNDAVTMARSRGLRLCDVDRVMTEGHGYPMGPFRLLDMIGLDVSLAILENIRGAVPELDVTIAPDLGELVRAGCLGRKTGRGFYPYAAG
jgi:3-hydroxybutyryl-CoA dehydrogenase